MESNSIGKCMYVLPNIPMKSMGKTHVDLTGKPYTNFLYLVLPLIFTANVYRQTADKLMFKSVISTVRCIRK